MYNNHYCNKFINIIFVPCETKYSSNKVLHLNFMITNRYDIRFRATKIMNQASKVHAFSGLTLLGFRFIFGS